MIERTKRVELAGWWQSLKTHERALSQRFDAAVSHTLNRTLAIVQASPLSGHAMVANLLERVQVPSGRSADEEIVTQGKVDSKKAAPSDGVSPVVTRWVAKGARLSFAGMVAIILWWAWPSASAYEPPVIEEAAAAEQPAAVVTLAIVNPANMGTSRLPPTLPPLHSRPAILSAPKAHVAETTAGSVFALHLPPARSGAADPLWVELQPLLPNLDLVKLPLRTGFVEGIGAASLAQEPTSTPVPADPGEDASVILAALAPTADPTPTPDLPMVEIVPAEGYEFFFGPATEVPSAGPAPTLEPTPVPYVLTPGRLWSNFVPQPPAVSDHFWIERPFPPFVAQQLDSPSYQFGSTAGSRYRIHHGIDIANPNGTPLRAGTVGEVVHAGPDDRALLGPYNNFYGNAVVIRLDRRLSVAGGELDVYLLYGHLSQVTVQSGQRVQPDDLVGAVGMTGIAIGPHLHVEVRLGANTYQNSVNPYLWMRPLDKTGAVAVRLLTADGRTWPDAFLTLAQFANGKAIWARQIEVYPEGEGIGPDPAWGENGAVGSVPPGSYVVVGTVNGERVRAELTVNAGETTFVEIRTQQ